MKVLTLISGGDVGGAKTHVLSLISQIMKDSDVTLVCFTEADFSQEARKIGINTIVLDTNVFSALSALKKMLRREKFDIIHCHGSRGNMMGVMLMGMGVPVVTTVHSDNRLDYLGRPFGALVYGNINRLALRIIRYHIGVSDAMTDLLISRGYDPCGMYTIYNGIDFTPTVPALDRKEFLRSIGCSFTAKDIIVGIAARLDPVKSVGTLVQAFIQASKTCPDMRLLIAGDGGQRHMLEKMAKDNGVGDKVFFAGWVQDMDSFYHAIDINTLTSLSETFPYAITEGAQVMLPTVSSAVGGVPMLIDHGINGYLFEPGDWNTLAGYLTEYYSSPEKRLDFGKKLHDKAESNFSLENTRRTQMDIYRSVLQREKRRKSGKKQGVVICGAYGRGNAGDEAILEAIVGEMRSIDRDMPICVMSRRPKETALKHRVRSVYTFNYPKYHAAMKRSKLYINGGGSLIQDITSSRSLLFYLSTLRSAKRAGCRVQMYGCGFGPIIHEKHRDLSAKYINRYVDVITLREDDSYREMADMGVARDKIVLSADPALTLKSAPANMIDSAFVRSGIPIDGNYICFTLRRWQGFNRKVDDFAAAAEYAYRVHGLTPVFVPIEPKVDITAAKQVMEKLTVPCYLAETGGSSGIIIGVYSRMKVVLSMRLHGLVFASSQGIPLVGAVYDKKVSSFLKYIGQRLFCDLDAVTANKLCSFIDEAVALGNDRSAILSAVQSLREIESRNTRQAARLLSEK